MQYLMFTYFNDEIAAAFEASTEEEQAAEVEKHMEWFTKWGHAVRAGHELAWPRQTGVLTSGNEAVVHDGPHPEAKEILGGVLIIEAKTLDDALHIASEWPSLENPGARVDVVPTHKR